MSELDSFLRAIKADPEDDTARLVFADWLDEQAPRQKGVHIANYTEWASNIQRQIAFSHCPRTDPRYWELFEPSHQRTLAKSALALVPPSVRKRKNFMIARGFADGVDVSVRHFPHMVKEIGESLAPLYRLNLSQGGRQLDQLFERHELAQFRHLAFSTFSLSDESAVAFAKCRHLENLTVLNLVDCRLQLNGLRALAMSPVLHQIRTLRLQSQSLDLPQFQTLIYSPIMETLEEIRLPIEATIEVTELVAETRFASRLKEFNFRFDKRSLIGPMIDRWFPALRSVSLSCEASATDTLRSLMHSETFTKLEYFASWGQGITTETWSNLPERDGALLTLKIENADPLIHKAVVNSPILGRCGNLILIGTRMTPDVLEDLVSTRRARNLRILHINWGASGASTPQEISRMIRAIASSPHLDGLLELHVADIGDEDLTALIDAPFAGSLRRIVLSGWIPEKTKMRLADPKVFPQLCSLSVYSSPNADPGVYESLRERFGEKYSVFCFE